MIVPLSLQALRSGVINGDDSYSFGVLSNFREVGVASNRWRASGYETQLADLKENPNFILAHKESLAALSMVSKPSFAQVPRRDVILWC